MEAFFADDNLFAYMYEMAGGPYGSPGLRGTCREMRARLRRPWKISPLSLAAVAIREDYPDLLEVAASRVDVYHIGTIFEKISALNRKRLWWRLANSPDISKEAHFRMAAVGYTRLIQYHNDPDPSWWWKVVRDYIRESPAINGVAHRPTATVFAYQYVVDADERCLFWLDMLDRSERATAAAIACALRHQSLCDTLINRYEGADSGILEYTVRTSTGEDQALFMLLFPGQLKPVARAMADRIVEIGAIEHVTTCIDVFKLFDATTLLHAAIIRDNLAVCAHCIEMYPGLCDLYTAFNLALEYKRDDIRDYLLDYIDTKCHAGHLCFIQAVLVGDYRAYTILRRRMLLRKRKFRRLRRILMLGDAGHAKPRTSLERDAISFAKSK